MKLYEYLRAALIYHKYTWIGIAAFTFALVSLVHPFGTPNYAQATIVKQLPRGHPRPTGMPRSLGTAWQIDLDGRTTSIRNITLADQVRAGDVICVAYTDRWPEGLKVFGQVDDENCEAASG